MCSAEFWNHTRFQRTDQARSRYAIDSAEYSAMTTEKRHQRSNEYWNTMSGDSAQKKRHRSASLTGRSMSSLTVSRS